MPRVTIERSKGGAVTSTGATAAPANNPLGILQEAGAQLHQESVRIQQKADKFAQEKKLATDRDYRSNAKVGASQEISLLNAKMSGADTSSVDYAKNYASEVDNILTRYLESAPSPEAAATLKESFVGTRINQFNKGLATEKEKFTAERETAWQTSSEIVLDAIQANPTDMEGHIENLQELVKIAPTPKVARELVRTADETQAYSLMDSNPELLGQMLDEGAFQSFGEKEKLKLKDQARARFENQAETDRITRVQGELSLNTGLYQKYRDADLTVADINNLRKEGKSNPETLDYLETQLTKGINDEDRRDPEVAARLVTNRKLFRVKDAQADATLEELILFRGEVLDAAGKGFISKAAAATHLQSTSLPLFDKANKERGIDDIGEINFWGLRGRDFYDEGYETVNSYLNSIQREDDVQLRASMYERFIVEADGIDFEGMSENKRDKELRRITQNIVGQEMASQNPSNRLMPEGSVNGFLDEDAAPINMNPGTASAPVAASLGTEGVLMVDESTGEQARVWFDDKGEPIKVEQLGAATGATKRATVTPQTFISKAEEFRGNVYRDVAGHQTIGFGHKLLPGEELTKITRKDAEALLKEDMKPARRAVSDAVTAKVTENQKTALTSLAFNIGEGAFRGSTLVKRINEGANPDKIAAEWKKWNKVTVDGKKGTSVGLTNRRRTELNLYAGG
jgi:lysozyme